MTLPISKSKSTVDRWTYFLWELVVEKGGVLRVHTMLFVLDKTQLHACVSVYVCVSEMQWGCAVLGVDIGICRLRSGEKNHCADTIFSGNQSKGSSRD